MVRHKFSLFFCYNLAISFHKLILVGGARAHSPVATRTKHSLSNNNNNKSNPVFEAFFTLNKTTNSKTKIEHCTTL